ncbi:uncharacterized protein EAF01_007978 [Botrytis porri]|uniref:Uncharacterized protein n=1 Tax=Botrytis porri TaxID=87229 RepID=A0A4Z1KMZ9_9HELO|nr:uncharacterized protein EAF01_007978 [Botrytis porri]KAF7900676.1 hypothetical protein EAF01_007978 [Botrytis porri]TGO82615.1 hypothetical protein BPOR_0791g00020 [Botrytis porri]
MNQAARALNETSQSLNFNKKLPPLEPYEGLDTTPQLEYKDQIAWIASHANNHAPSAIVLAQAKSSTWQQMLASLEAINRVRHPNVREAYIKWRSQDMLVKRLWENAKFPGVDPDPVYTQIRRKYCTAVKKLINEKAEQGEDDTAALIYLNETYNKKLMLARRFEVSNESFSDRIRTIKVKKAKETQEAKEAEKRIKEIEAEEEREEMMEQGGDDEFVVLEMEHADDEDFEWEGDDWDMS